MLPFMFARSFAKDSPFSPLAWQMLNCYYFFKEVTCELDRSSGNKGNLPLLLWDVFLFHLLLLSGPHHNQRATPLLGLNLAPSPHAPSITHPVLAVQLSPLFPKHTQYSPTSGSLHRFCPLLGILFPDSHVAHSLPSSRWSLRSNEVFPEHPPT